MSKGSASERGRKKKAILMFFGEAEQFQFCFFVWFWFVWVLLFLFCLWFVGFFFGGELFFVTFWVLFWLGLFCGFVLFCFLIPCLLILTEPPGFDFSLPLRCLWWCGLAHTAVSQIKPP